jgi:hypothetical protein
MKVTVGTIGIVALIGVATTPAAAATSASTRPFRASMTFHATGATTPPFLVGDGTGTVLGHFTYEFFGPGSLYRAANGDVMVTVPTSPTYSSGTPCKAGETRADWTETVVRGGSDFPASTGRFAHATGTISLTGCGILASDGTLVGDLRVSERGTITYR